MSNAANSQRTPIRLSVITALSLFGALGAGYLSKVYYDIHSGTAGFRSFCNLNKQFNCDAVAASPYAEVFRGLPLSSIVSGWMIALFFVSLAARSSSWRKDAIRVGTVLSGISILISIVYLFIMTVLVKTLCIVCLSLDVVTIGSFLIFLSLKPIPLSQSPMAPGALKSWGSLVAVSVVVMAILLKSFQPDGPSENDIRDAYESVLNSPVISVNAGPEFPTIGNPSAPITIVEFSDLQRPACRMGAMLLKTVLARYPDDVKVVYRAFPLDPSCNRSVQHSMHPVACEATRVGLCSNAQGKFESVYETIFDRQSELVPGKAAEIAASLGVNAGTLAECAKSGDIAQKITRDVEEGINFGVESTPTFFINGHRMDGVYPFAVWGKLIDALKKSK